MAGKGGGGAWKVAYADFVTAMMAFFLVMWLSAQDQSVKQSVANYFNRVDPIGASKKPGERGSLFSSQTRGNVPAGDDVALGTGRESYNSPGESSSATRLVGEWLFSDDKITSYWKQQAQRSREAASISETVRNNTGTVDEVARLNLAGQLKEEFAKGIPPHVSSVQQDLFIWVLSEVNWPQLAEDLLRNQ